jgi:hypothetical protein
MQRGKVGSDAALEANDVLGAAAVVELTDDVAAKARIEDERVSAVAAVQLIIAKPAIRDVRAIQAKQAIIARTACDHVVAVIGHKACRYRPRRRSDLCRCRP